MTMEPIAIEIEELTPEQASAIWQAQKREAARPANYGQFVMYVRAKSIGQAFDVKVDTSTPEKNEAHAAAIKKYMGLAGKERVRFDTVDGKTVEVPEPVIIRWKQTSHKQTIKVKDAATGKMGDVEVVIIDKLHGKMVDAADFAGRGRGAADTDLVDEIVNKMTVDAKAKTVDLPDGRKATKTRSGHWRAPKLPEPTSNGTVNEKAGAAA
jgi:hypothetical protein